MGRHRSKPKELKKKGAVGYHHEAVAIRWVSDGDNDTGFSRAEQVMKCSFGYNDVPGFGSTYYANGEINASSARGYIRVTVTGFKRDVVNLAFQAALKRIGFRIKKGA